METKQYERKMQADTSGGAVLGRLALLDSASLHFHPVINIIRRICHYKTVEPEIIETSENLRNSILSLAVFTFPQRLALSP